MADVKGHSDPSMEEILASIRRIIAEDGDTGAPAQPAAVAPEPQNSPQRPMVPPQPAAVPPTQDAILELTDRVDDEEPVRNIASGAMASGFGTRSPFASSASSQPPQAPQPPAGSRLTRPPPLKTGATPGEPPKRIVSDAAAAASVATLVQLAGLGQRERQHELPLGDVGRTLEEMVRELLRPHLKEWLDANLPRLVERLVREEIHRLVREAQGNN